MTEAARVLDIPMATPPPTDPVLLKLVQDGTLTTEGVRHALDEAQSNGADVEAWLLQTGALLPADLILAKVAANPHQRIYIDRFDDLPEFNEVLTKQPPGGADHALIANSVDARKQAFLLVTEKTNDAALQRAYALAAKEGKRVAAKVHVSSDLLPLVYSDHAGSVGSEARIGESKLQREFWELGLMALRAGASDIHLTQRRGRAQAAFRIHGELEKVRDYTEQHMEELCASIYNTLAEKGSTKAGFNPGMLQDAVIERVYPEGLVRFRYSGLPLAPAGFDVTLRLIPLGKTTKSKTFEQLGYAPNQCRDLRRLFAYATGMLIFAGITGSGKSTSLATGLERTAAEYPGLKIRTVEEPVEFRINGVYQTAVKRIQGDASDFQNVLRQILRADPDKIMIGEIRDLVTAQMAIAAAITGHMVSTTLHTDSAVNCFERLAGMGVQRQELAISGLIIGTVFQRLLPVLCPRCKVNASEVASGGPQWEAEGEIIERLASLGNFDGVYFRNRRGCEHCRGRGVVDRTVCAEILRPTPKILTAVTRGDTAEVWHLWRKSIRRDDPDDMTGRTAFEHALFKMRQGLVSPASVEREFHFLDEKPYEEFD